MTPEAQLQTLVAGTAKVLSEKELLERLKLGRPLRVKLGLDPTSPDIHLGHTVAMEKLRQFQEFGHQVVLIIGDFTATIGDPSGRSATRPPLSREEVLANAKTYTDQAFKILDKDRTEVVYNGEWFRKMTFEDVLRLNARVTMQQMLQREDFRNRIDKGQEVRLHEIQYPIVQGWDSVEVRADVELGGTDQLFNLLVGRDLQKEEGQPQQIVMTMPLLEGLDGVRKMSKSYDNYVGVSDEPQDMFGKLMSISDELMARYYLLLFGETLPADARPMEAKKSLAEKLTARYHGDEAGKEARADWDTRFSKKNLVDADLPELPCPGETTVLALASSAFETAFELKKSNGELRKQFILPGAVQLNGDKLTDPTAMVAPQSGDILKLSKKHAVRFI
ncbi:tyrosine--tRNA ligase [Haloferula sp. A504]|uniref:tyrosine--tRNA ligase n=1 Tax=Haloferula sp. A504 TaxID=3373601 RepID=UPI0031C8CDE5|nr:tyrosine--tRNA ligase [Verrucomicrobiaceae bacterium E54]